MSRSIHAHFGMPQQSRCGSSKFPCPDSGLTKEPKPQSAAQPSMAETSRQHPPSTCYNQSGHLWKPNTNQIKANARRILHHTYVSYLKVKIGRKVPTNEQEEPAATLFCLISVGSHSELRVTKTLYHNHGPPDSKRTMTKSKSVYHSFIKSNQS